MEPVFLTPYIEEKVWGGNLLHILYGKISKKGSKIGESWEVSAFSDKQSIVRNGEFVSMSLSQFYGDHHDLFGMDSPEFPFIIKLIDAKLSLSVQVHEKDSDSRNGKCEAWVVLDATPGAKIVLGANIKTQQQLKASIEEGVLEEYLNYVDVKPGDVFFIPPGTIHAIGAGILLYEIQQPSDVTYRLHDPSGNRELHIEQGCGAYHYYAPYRKVVPKDLGNGSFLLLDCEHFMVEKINADDFAIQTDMDHFSVYTALAKGKIVKPNQEISYDKGDTFIIPVGFGEFMLSGGTLLKAYYPGGR